MAGEPLFAGMLPCFPIPHGSMPRHEQDEGRGHREDLQAQTLCVSASLQGARPRKELGREKHKGEAKADWWVAVIAVLGLRKRRCEMLGCTHRDEPLLGAESCRAVLSLFGGGVEEGFCCCFPGCSGVSFSPSCWILATAASPWEPSPIPASSHQPVVLSSHSFIIPSSHHPMVPSSHHCVIPSTHHPILPSSQPPILSSSHPPMVPSTHHPIVPSSHQPIIASTHHPILPSSHLPIVPSSHHPMVPSTRCPIVPSSHHPITPSPHRPIIPSSHHPITSHRPIIPWSHGPITPSSHHHPGGSQ